MLKFVFKAGIRKVTVEATDYAGADDAARGELDRRCEKAGIEPPVGWTLQLLSANPILSSSVARTPKRGTCGFAKRRDINVSSACKNPTEPRHACPYASDVGGDDSKVCMCCTECQNTCAADI